MHFWKRCLRIFHVKWDETKLSAVRRVLTDVAPAPVFLAISWKLTGRENSTLVWDSCRGCRNAVAMTCLRGVATVKGCGRGLTMCWMLFFFEGAGVGGNGVGAGEGAPRWLMTTGMVKSYAAT